ncbi:PAS domain S-box protein [Vibrio parahaemolyticus]|uniref:PAS domain S-box protein n=1 Tax=Vibrio parahaemolyticus TaxID=670 RepID=UPI000A65F89A|nr:PAS domain S-box protein [Vibrio parahaemolyticus]
MFGLRTQNQEAESEYNRFIKGLSDSMAMIEFDTRGIILNANDLFLSCVGYTREAIVGKHHSISVTEAMFNPLDTNNFGMT